MEKLKKFNTKEEYQEWKDSDDYSYPNVCKVADEIVYNDYPGPLWIEALEDINFEYNHQCDWSLDKINWKNSVPNITLRKGQTIYIKDYEYTSASYLTISGRFNVGGDIRAVGDVSLVNHTNRKYEYLFRSAKGVVSAKELVLADPLPDGDGVTGAYDGLFQDCTLLKEAPKLTMKTLKYHCFQDMFTGCTSLERISILGTKSGQSGLGFLHYAFSGCTSLKYIKLMYSGKFTPSNGSSGDWSCNWVKGVSSTGTFIANVKRTDFTRGAHGIPEGWDLYLYDEDNDRYVVKFKVNGIPYEYYTDEPKDITWNEFINSEYNTNGFTAQQEDGETAKTIKFGDNYVLLSGNKVLITDKVILNVSYTIGQPTQTTTEEE